MNKQEEAYTNSIIFILLSISIFVGTEVSIYNVYLKGLAQIIAWGNLLLGVALLFLSNLAYDVED